MAAGEDANMALEGEQSAVSATTVSQALDQTSYNISEASKAERTVHNSKDISFIECITYNHTFMFRCQLGKDEVSGRWQNNT